MVAGVAMPKPGEHNHKMTRLIFLVSLNARWGVVFAPADVYKTDVNPQSNQNQNNFWHDPNQTLISVIILNGVKKI